MSRPNRKDEHVKFAQAFYKDTNDAFDDVHVLYDSLASLDMSMIDPSLTLFNKPAAYPVYINAMTGGSPDTRKINQAMATIAKECGIMMAVGSQTAAIKHPQLIDTYSVVREINPEGCILANIGAENPPETAMEAVAMIQADALQVHVNRAQEVMMSEGERDFRSWQQNIREITEAVNVPVIVKEVGFGMSYKTLRTCIGLGVSAVDVSGRGGTDFITIENARANRQHLNFLKNTGLTTVQSLCQAQSLRGQLTLFASGGIRNPLDVFKCLVLGATAVGISGLVLNRVMKGDVDETITWLKQWLTDFETTMALFGVQSLKEISDLDYILGATLQEYLK